MNLYKNKRLILVTLIPIIFSLVLLYLYLPAFYAIEENIEEINVVIVNEDMELGEKIADQIKANAPFTLIEETSIDEAMKQLEARTAHMIIEIPKNFTVQIQKGNPEINFIIDEARQPTIKSTMENASEKITQLLNENMYEKKKEKISAEIEEFYSKGPNNESLLKSKEIVVQILEELNYKSIYHNTIKLNENNHSLNHVLPLLIFLTIFISALLYSLLYEKKVKLVQSEISFLHVFCYKQLLNILAAMLYPLAIVLIFNSFNVKMTASYLTLWLFLTITFYMFSVFIQMFLDLFSFIGIGLLMLLLLFQILASGIILPTELVTTYYSWASPFLPATYFTNGIYGIIYTGTSIGNALISLTIFGVIALILSLIYITIKNKKV